MSEKLLDRCQAEPLNHVTSIEEEIESANKARILAPRQLSHGLSVFLSFDLNSGKRRTGICAMHGGSHVAEAARKGRTEVSTKHLNSEELTTSRQAKQTRVQKLGARRRRRGRMKERDAHQNSNANALGIDEEVVRALQSAYCRPRVSRILIWLTCDETRPPRVAGLAMFSSV